MSTPRKSKKSLLPSLRKGPARSFSFSNCGTVIRTCAHVSALPAQPSTANHAFHLKRLDYHGLSILRGRGDAHLSRLLEVFRKNSTHLKGPKTAKTIHTSASFIRRASGNPVVRRVRGASPMMRSCPMCANLPTGCPDGFGDVKWCDRVQRLRRWPSAGVEDHTEPKSKNEARLESDLNLYKGDCQQLVRVATFNWKFDLLLFVHVLPSHEMAGAWLIQ